MTTRTIHVTHNDLDGVGCAVLSTRVLGAHNVEVFTVGYDTYEKRVESLVQSGALVGKELLVTDLTPTKKLCDLLETQRQKQGFTISWLDHHVTGKTLIAHYPWGKYHTEAATKMLLRHFIDCASFPVMAATQGVLPLDYVSPGSLRSHDDTLIVGDTDGSSPLSASSKRMISVLWQDCSPLLDFAEAVNAYDLWLTDPTYRPRGDRLHRLLAFIGAQDFICTFSQTIEADTVDEKLHYVSQVLATNQERECARALLRNPPPVQTTDGGLKYLTVVVTQYVSQIADAVLSAYPKIDFVAVVNPAYNSCSLRSRQGSQVNVAEVASRVPGGGGHYHAAGFQLNATRTLRSMVDEQLF